MEKVQEVKISVLKTSKHCSEIASKYSNFHQEHHTTGRERLIRTRLIRSST